jgi:hypothetical protein
MAAILILILPFWIITWRRVTAEREKRRSRMKRGALSSRGES